MIAIALQSGSNGNCIYVESGDVRLLIDAGITGRQADQRLTDTGRNIRDVDALLISHDHSDHTRSMGIFQRKFRLPIHITERTLAATRRRARHGELHDIQLFSAGDTLSLEHLTVESVPTPHDAVDGVAFVVDDGEHRLGVLTDLGHVFESLGDIVATLDAVVIESNYDPNLLDSGPYPERLKQRIRGAGGHLSNDESAQLLAQSANDRLKWACLAHLSERNNSPERALDAHRQLLGDRLTLHVADRYAATPCLEVGSNTIATPLSAAN